MSLINLVKGFLFLMIGSASPESWRIVRIAVYRYVMLSFCDCNMLNDYRSHMLKLERHYGCPGSAPFKDQKQIPKYCPNRGMILAVLTTI